MRRIAFYGGTFDPIHNGHLAVSRAILNDFALDEFVFIPAFHAPHKVRTLPTPAIDRYAMLCLATSGDENISVSKIEIDLPARPFTIETIERLRALHTDSRIFFVMGADSWQEITTWREWEKLLTSIDHIVVSRPGYELSTDHVGSEIGSRITRGPVAGPGLQIHFSEAVVMDVSATEIRGKIREKDPAWRRDVPDSVAKYIDKYQIYR